jgi:hypothetical protein
MSDSKQIEDLEIIFKSFNNAKLGLITQKIEVEKIKMTDYIYGVRIKVYQIDKNNEVHIKTLWGGYIDE